MNNFKTQFELFGKIAPGWKMIRPLEITIEQDDNEDHMANDDEFCVYGYGNTQLLALRDYATSLIEYYQLIEKHMAFSTQAIFVSLKSYINRIQ